MGVLPCGDGDASFIDDGLGGAVFDGAGESFESRGLGLCCLGPESNDLGIGGSVVQSAAFTGHISDGSRHRGDVAVSSLTGSTTLTHTPRSCTTIGAASVKLMMKNIRRIRTSILYHRIFVGYVVLIRQGYSGRSMKSKKGRDTVQKKPKMGYKLEEVNGSD